MARLDLRPPKEPVALLYSGGVDSCALFGLLLERGVRVVPVHVRAGHAWEADERRAVEAFARAIGFAGSVRSIALEAGPLSEAARGGYAPAYREGIEANYLPGRNLVLLAAAAIAAAADGARTLAIATLAGNPYPDARPSFFGAFGRAAGLALGTTLAIWSPLRDLEKPDLVRAARHLPLELSMSCVFPENGLHCGDRCNKCAERQRAFAIAGVPDRTRYARPCPVADWTKEEWWA